MIFGQLALAGVLATAGGAKLTTGRDARRLALAVVEIAIAALVLVPATALAGSLLAAVLLAGFSGAIAARIARGDSSPCRCFGRLGSGRVGPGTLVRNALLLALALAVAAGALTG